MAIKNSIPLKGNDDPRSVAIRAKTKGTASPKRKLSQQIRRMREFPEKHNAEIVKIATDPKYSALEIIRFMKSIVNNSKLNNNQKIALLGRMNSTHTSIHGAKIDIMADIKITKLVISDLALLERIRFGFMLEQKKKEFMEKFGEEGLEWLNDLFLHIHIQLNNSNKAIDEKKENEVLEIYKDKTLISLERLNKIMEIQNGK